MFPPLGSPLLIWTIKLIALVRGLPLDILCAIFYAEAAFRHEFYCPFALYYDDLDGAYTTVRRPCTLEHCPHECCPTYTLVHVCREWGLARSVAVLWSVFRMRVDMDYTEQTDISTLFVYNLTEYAFCAKYSGNSSFRLSIGCDTGQKEDVRLGRPIVKRRMVLDVEDALERLTSLCFDGSNGRLVAALGIMEAPKLKDVYILQGASDSRWPTHMYMVKDAAWMCSGTVERVYCSFEFSLDSGPLVFNKGYENLRVVDLSCSGSYHEEAVEWMIALGKGIEELRIQTSINRGSHPWIITNAAYMIRGWRMPQRIISHIQRLYISHYVGAQANHLDRRNFLSRFEFPYLEELVLQYCNGLTFPSNISWLLRTPFPSLTTFQCSSDSIRLDLLSEVLIRMPVLETLIFADGTWASHPSWTSAARSGLVYQDNSFLAVLGQASSTLRVVKLGGNVWFDRYALLAFLTAPERALRLFVVEVWFTVVNRQDLDDIKASVLPVVLECGQYGLCHVAMRTGSKPHGADPNGWNEWDCSTCSERHSMMAADNVSPVGLIFQSNRRTYWAGF